MGSEEPPFLTVGTDVSAKYKGAFCEAKIKKVNKQVKCKVTFKNNAGTVMIPEDQIRGGPFRLGAKVEAKHPDKNSYMEAVINKVVDYSQYTVVFDDGDETTLRRSSLCLKSGRHFAESETLDQLPLTNPEHFSTPVVNTKLKRKRSSIIQDDDSSDDDSHLSSSTPPPHPAKKVSSPSPANNQMQDRSEYGKVLICQVDQEKKRYSHFQRDSSRESWFPGLVVSPRASPNTSLSKGEILVRSFKDGRYVSVQKKDTKPFIKDKEVKTENNALRTGLEHAKNYLDKGKLPSSWESMTIYSDSDDESEESSDDEPSEIKDRFVAQLISFLDRKRTPINKVPTVNNKDLNLYKLYHTVQKFGGYNKVTNQGLWKKVSIKMGMTTNLAQSSSIYETYYVRYLQDFENFYRQLGCTMTASPSSGRSQRVDRNIIHTRTRNKTNTPPPTTSSPSSKKKKEKAKSPERDSKEDKTKEEPEETIKKEKSESPEKKETRGNAKASQDLKKEEKAKPKKDEKQKDLKKEEKPKDSKKEEKAKETKKEDKSKDNAKKDDKGKEMKKDEKIKDIKKEEKAKETKKDDKAKEEDKKKDEKNKLPKKDDKLKETKKDDKVKETKKEEKVKEPKKEPEKLKKKEKAVKEEKTPNKKEEKSEKKGDKTKAKEDKAKGDKVITPVAKKDKKEKKEEKSKKAKSDDDSTSPLKTPAQKKKMSPKVEEVKRSASLDKKKPEEPDPLSSPPLLSPPHHPEEPPPRDLGPIGVGDRIWVKYVRGENNLVGNYEAKVMKMEHLDGGEKKYFIHYRGWNGRHDQWVTEDLITEVVQKNSRSSEKKLPVLSKSTDVKPPGKRGRPFKQSVGGGRSQSSSEKTSSPSSTKRRSCKKSEISQSEASSQASESSSESSSESDSAKHPPDLEDGEEVANHPPEKDDESIPSLESSDDISLKQEIKVDQEGEENEEIPPLDVNPEPPPDSPKIEVTVPEATLNEESNDSQLDKEIAATSAEIALELTSKESHSDHEDLPTFEFNMGETLTSPLSMRQVSFKLEEIRNEPSKEEEFQGPPLIFESHPPEITKCVDAPNIVDTMQETNEKIVEGTCPGEDEEEEPELPTIDKIPPDVHPPKRIHSEIKLEDEESDSESSVPAKKLKFSEDKEDDAISSFPDLKESIKRKSVIKSESDLDFTSEESSDSKKLKLNNILLETKDDSDKESDMEKNERNEEVKEEQENIKEEEEEEDDSPEVLGAVSSQDESEGPEDPKDLYITEDSSMSLEVATATKEAEEIAFLFCQEKVPASPPPALLNPSADDAAQDASEVLASLSESVVGGVGNNGFPPPSTVLDNTPPTTPESSLLSTSPSHGSDPCSGRDSADSCDRAKEGPAGSFTPTYPELSTSSISNVKPDPENGPSQKKKKPRNRTNSESSAKHKRKHKDSFSENGKSGKSFPRYNFLAGLDSIENSEKKIQVLHERMVELKKVYQQIKTEIALIDRRRKKTKRKEKEAALSSS